MRLPAPRLLMLATLPLALTLFVPMWPEAWPVVVAVDTAVLLLAVLDALVGAPELSVSRRVGQVHAVGEAFEVVLTLTNPGQRAVSVVVDDDLQAEVVEPPLPCTVPAGGSEEVRWVARSSVRGRITASVVSLRTHSRGALWQRQRWVPCPCEVRIYPDFRYLKRDLNGVAGAQRAPVRARRRPGGENEFERLRAYVPGDPYKHIDWKASARRQRFISREYGQESNQTVLFLLDAGRHMGARLGQLTAFDHALNASLAMAHAALRKGDRAGLMVFGKELRAFVPPKTGVRHGHTMLRSTFDVFPRDEATDFGAALRRVRQKVRHRALVVLVTSGYDDVMAGHVKALVRASLGRHVVLTAWLRDPAVHAALRPERLEGTPEEDTVFARAAAAEVASVRERGLRSLERAGALVVDVSPGELGPALLNRYLEIKARRLL